MRCMQIEVVFVWIKTRPKTQELGLISFDLQCYNFLLSRANMTHLCFFKKTSTCCVLVLVYLDDIIVPLVVSLLITSLQQHFQHFFHIKDLGTLTFLLGLEVYYVASRVLLNQHKYTHHLISLAGLQDFLLRR